MVVDLVVLVVVAGSEIAGIDAPGSGEEERGRIGIAAGQDVPGPVGAELGLLDQELGQVKGRLSGQGHGAFHVGGDEDGRQEARFSRRLGADLEKKQVAAARGLGQGVDTGKRGIGAGHVLDGGVDFGRVMVAVEGRGSRSGGLGRRGHQSQG
jgi:hypothetical protein